MNYLFAPENMEKIPSIVAHNRPTIFCQMAQNQHKSHFLFHKNVSLHDFYIGNDFVYVLSMPFLTLLMKKCDVDTDVRMI